ncbi:hypothetical protein BO86DRAFT_397138 [Aspergillus japonicus CBS 114.51]|uniref:Rhodopsin domain-containing protein n=2 Tax=Aspergillus TaxID=5052 RepID=A0A2V5HG95_ASPV1|nr:hypothetical protein BO86DRAFT_397138 [Aspergillus japonicus CBS 114.51]PYI23439.1 hypothetical protein BO99DRAFT_428733 [Aspergillus violaceofuscus CBS 115571]RAH84271.1 hypothetical protein BO86DRAFT_397138 [Aspergillus japonicus CBS 114.51]
MAVSSRPITSLVLMDLFGGLGALIMILRLFLRKYRHQRFEPADYCTVFCLVTLLACVSLLTAISVITLTRDARLQAQHFTDKLLEEQLLKNKMLVAHQAIFRAYLWGQKAVVLLFISRVLEGLAWPFIFVRISWAILLLSFGAVELEMFMVCDYRKKKPCLGRVGNLVAYILLNGLTDLILIVLPLPWLIRVKRPWHRRLQLIALFSVGFLCIIATILRAPIHRDTQDLVGQGYWTAVEFIASAIVANFPTLYSLRRARKPETPIYPDNPYPARRGGSKVRSATSIELQESLDMDHLDADPRMSGKITSQASNEPLFFKDSETESLRVEGLRSRG